MSGLAAAHSDTGIAVGNIVGSNILNLTLLLDSAAILAPTPVASVVIRRQVPLAIVAIGLFGLLAAVVGLNGWTAAVLVAAGVAALWLLAKWARAGRNEAMPADEVHAFRAVDGDAGQHETVCRRLWVEPVRAVLGLLGVLAGAQLLVSSASAIAESVGLSQVVIGSTLVALARRCRSWSRPCRHSAGVSLNWWSAICSAATSSTVWSAAP